MPDKPISIPGMFKNVPSFKTSTGMSNLELTNMRKRALQGDYFELEGAFDDLVFLPRTYSDFAPSKAMLRDRLKLKKVQEYIKWNKGNRSKSYLKPGVSPIG